MGPSAAELPDAFKVLILLTEIESTVCQFTPSMDTSKLTFTVAGEPVIATCIDTSVLGVSKLAAAPAPVAVAAFKEVTTKDM